MWEHISHVPQGSLSVLNPVRRIGDTFKSFIGAHMDLSSSGGQYEELVRKHLARALITGPSLITADGPVSMVDASLKMSVCNKVLKKKHRVSVIYITHDLATVY